MKSEMIFSASVLFTFSFLLSVLFETRLLPVLRRKKAGQPILEIGPSWHMSKSGTPTLGGLGFAAGAAAALLLLELMRLLWGGESNAELLLLLGFALCAGGIGFLDDRCKLSKRQNQGLSAPQKYALQLLASALFLFLAEILLAPSHAIALPFSDRVLELGMLYYPMALLYLTGIMNALNLTDGVDGLLSSLCAVFAAFLILWALLIAQRDAALTGALLLGVSLGFLCFNVHPAKVFMGDTGSLFLGAIVAGYGILSPSPLCVLLACGVFVLEAGSVILQVLWFKISGGKRLFRMAPLHHHFEKGGWSENRVVACFCVIESVFVLLALLSARMR